MRDINKTHLDRPKQALNKAGVERSLSGGLPFGGAIPRLRLIASARNGNAGFGLIGLVIVIAVIVIIVFGAGKFGPDKTTQIEQGQDAIDQAKDAHEAQNQYDLYLQNEIANPPPVNYDGVRDQLKNIQQ